MIPVAYLEYFRDFRVFAGVVTLPDVTGLPAGHPTCKLREILEAGVSPALAVNLRRVHAWCQARYDTGIRDFTSASIRPLLSADLGLHKTTFRGGAHGQLRASWDTFAWKDSPRQANGKKLQQNHDMSFSVARRDHPELAQWCDAAESWVTRQKGVPAKLSALNQFMRDFILKHNLPLNPNEFLLAETEVPDFAENYADIDNASTPVNAVHSFLNDYLLKNCSEESDKGYKVISPLFRNHVNKITSRGAKADTTVQTPLPYGMIDELRQMLIQGPDFKDWTWAQTAAGVAPGKRGALSDEWFDVSESEIDPNDPDCVHRQIQDTRGKVRLQMWSPVRSCALAIKLIIPPRGGQIRWLDSGEGDSLRYESGNWVPNTHPLAKIARASGRKGDFGVLRRPIDFDSIDEGLEGGKSLFINTNKSAANGGQAKGYAMPWFESDEVTSNVFYWLEKMRNWQEKYNPAHAFTHWKDLDGRHHDQKSDDQLLPYPPATFLFRTRELKTAAERAFPVTIGHLEHRWTLLLSAYEEHLERIGRTHEDGSKIRLVKGSKKHRAPLYSLHVIRVSLLTALAMDAGVPFNVLKRIAGHSRLVMTIYYVKVNSRQTTRILREAEIKLKADSAKNMVEHLSSIRHEELSRQLASNHYETLRKMIPIVPAERNPVGWAQVHNGICLAAGNTAETGQGKTKSAGCHNGHPEVIEGEETGVFLPVPGGPRNCIRCRWLVTGPEYAPALVATFNNKSYQLDELATKVRKAEQELQALRRGRAKAESLGGVFDHGRELKEAENLVSNHIAAANLLAEDMVFAYQMTMTCVRLAQERSDAGQLVVHGSGAELMVALDDAESELLQLSGICRDALIYPSLDADKATLQMSQYLDAALYDEGFAPLFMRLDVEQQRAVGTAFLESLARKMNANNEEAGRRKAIEAIECGKRLGELIGVPLNSLLPPIEEVQKLAVRRTARALEVH